MAEVKGTGVEQMRLLSLRLKAAPRVMRTSLRNNLKDAAGQTVRDVQKSILSMGVHGKEHSGLRAEVAATVGVSVRFTKNEVRMDIVADGRKMPPEKESLPAHMDSARGWAHPVYKRPGRDAPWVRQTAKPAWFEHPVIEAYPDLRRAAQRAIDGAQRALGA